MFQGLQYALLFIVILVILTVTFCIIVIGYGWNLPNYQLPFRGWQRQPLLLEEYIFFRFISEYLTADFGTLF